jgi:hypothetical protein
MRGSTLSALVLQLADRMNIAAILVATVLTVVFSAGWYISMRARGAAFGADWATRSRPPRWQLPVTFVRALVVAVVVAWLLQLTAFNDVGSAIGLALALWVAFPVVLLVGSVLQEKVPLALASIHAIDWLAKLLIITIVLTVWH